MSTPAHDALTAARDTLADIESRLASLARDHAATERELAETDAELTRQLGAEQIGEADLAALSKARDRHERAALSMRSIVAGRAVLTERLPAAQHAVALAEAAFRAEAADLIAPLHDRLCSLLAEQASALASTYARLAQVATVRGRVPAGVVTGQSLLRAAGDPLEQIRRDQHVSIDLGFLREPRRFTETELLTRIAPAAEAAE